jgi:hypothetical protein
MQQIKFVLWERYRAWWGAHQLNEKNPLILDHLKGEEKANKLGMTIGQYRQHRVIEEKKAKIAIVRNEENKEKATLREGRRLGARKLAEERAMRKVKEERAELERKVKEEQERKDAAILEMYQNLAVGGGPELAKLKTSVAPMKGQAESQEVNSEGDKGGETVDESGDGKEKPDDTPK